MIQGVVSSVGGSSAGITARIIVFLQAFVRLLWLSGYLDPHAFAQQGVQVSDCMSSEEG